MLKFMKYFYFSLTLFFGTFILVFPYHGDIVLLFRENCFLILSFSKSEKTQNIPTIPTFHDLNSYFCPSFSKFWALLYPCFFTGGHLKACRCVTCKRNNSHFVRYVLISLDVQMPQVYLFSKLYVTFILQPIAFIFGRDEEDDQYKCRCILCKRELSLFLLCTYLPWRPRFTFWLTFLQSYISLLFLIGLLSYLVELKMRTSRRVVCKRDNLPWHPRFTFWLTFWLTFFQSCMWPLLFSGLLSSLVGTSRRVGCKRDNSHIIMYWSPLKSKSCAGHNPYSVWDNISGQVEVLHAGRTTLALCTYLPWNQNLLQAITPILFEIIR